MSPSKYGEPLVVRVMLPVMRMSFSAVNVTFVA